MHTRKKIIEIQLQLIGKIQNITNGMIIKIDKRGEWPSSPASFISLTEVKHGCVRSETGWVTFR